MDQPAFTSLAEARVAIVGLGLMGGSLALALRRHCAEIVGVDSDPEAIRFARAHAIVDRSGDFASILDCDLIVLAAPVRAILKQLASLASLKIQDSRIRVVLDLGSTKNEIANAMQALPPGFSPIGGHPMCGKELNGIANAGTQLFRDKTFILTPLTNTTSAALALVQEVIAVIGAKPFVLSAERQDALVAMCSHVPYLTSAALMRMALSLGDDDLWTIASSGFRDASRLAATDVTMMIDILLTNRAPILSALKIYRHELDSLIELIEAGEAVSLRAALAPAQTRRMEWMAS